MGSHSFSLCYGLIFFTQLSYCIKNLFFAICRRLFESVDVVSKQRGIDTDAFCKFCDVEFLVCQEEPLYLCRLCVLVFKTLETDVRVKVAPIVTCSAQVPFRFCECCYVRCPLRILKRLEINILSCSFCSLLMNDASMISFHLL